MPNLNNTRAINCWTCKHFAEDYTQGQLNGQGECRCLPPLQVEADDTNEPVFPFVLHGTSTWCSAWMQRRDSLGVCPPIVP